MRWWVGAGPRPESLGLGPQVWVPESRSPGQSLQVWVLPNPLPHRAHSSHDQYGSTGTHMTHNMGDMNQLYTFKPG